MRLVPTSVFLGATLIACNSVFGVDDYTMGPGGSGAGGVGATGGGGTTDVVGGSGGVSAGGNEATTAAGGDPAGGGGMGGAPDPCGNGVLDANEECDLGTAQQAFCVDCLVVCPGVSTAAVRVGAANEPHCYVGVGADNQSDVSAHCNALGAGWYLLEFNDMPEHDWLNANRSAVGISTAKYFWTGARRTNGGYSHPNGQSYPEDNTCDPPDGLWAVGDPCDDADTEACTALGLSADDPGLNDVGCNEYTFEGICEWQP